MFLVTYSLCAANILMLELMQQMKSGEPPSLANAALKGRLGRLVVAFPNGAMLKETRFDVLKDGRSCKAGTATNPGNCCPARTK